MNINNLLRYLQNPPQTSNLRHCLVITVLLLLPVLVSAEVPMYAAEFMGPGSSASMNNHGHIVGNESTSQPGIPWVNDNNGFRRLPIPIGMSGAIVADINDNGLIVGSVYSTDSILTDMPAKWVPNELGVYTVEVLPLAGTATRGKAVAVNNPGHILVNGFGVGDIPTYTAYLVDDNLAIPLNLFNPVDINDNGLVLTNNTLFDISTMTELGIPAPENFSASMFPSSLNNNNQVAVTLLTALIDNVRYVKIGVYTVGVGWNIVLDSVTNMNVSDINDNGDLTIGGDSLPLSCGGLVYFIDEGFYCSTDLLGPAFDNWMLGDNIEISNDRKLLAYGISDAGQFGIIRISPAGDLPLPQAPLNLVATAHLPTTQQPFISIDLSWEAADTLAKSFVIERKQPNESVFMQIAEVSITNYRDLGVQADQVYEYRVLARGVAGTSPPSDVVRIETPSAPDTEAPTVEILSPLGGDLVSGVVPVEVVASDNIAIAYIVVTASGMDCRSDNQETASCNWNTKNLPGGEYTITALAVDTFGNNTNASLTVTVEETAKGRDKNKPNNGNGGKGNGKGKGNK